MGMSTGVFQMRRLPDDDGDITVAHADLSIDPLGTVVVTVVDWSPEGYNRDSFAWQRGNWLRFESVVQRVQLVSDWELEGDFSLEREWPIDPNDIESLMEAFEDEDADAALEVFARLMPEMAIGPVTAETLTKLRDDRSTSGPDLDAVVGEMPRWEPNES